jgi:hypothetical protein
MSREREVASQAAPRDLYYGTTRQLTLGMGLAAQAAAHPELDAMATGGMRRRAGAVPVAGSIRDATVIAAIRAEVELKAVSSSQLRVYRVQGEPFHSGPMAIIEELCQRMRARGPRKELIREYWNPSGIWYLCEVLVPSLIVIEEVASASERDTYVPRWVLYREDAERARTL